MNLSPHFTLEELTASQTAARRGLDNRPLGRALVNLPRLALALELVRALLDAPIIVSSGYRSPALNRAVGGSSNSAHMYGLAADLIAPQYGSVLAVWGTIAGSDLPFDQLILEYGQWVHFAISTEGVAPRRKAFRLPE